MTSMAQVNGIEIGYETLGDAADEPLLLVMGLGSQLTAWPLEMCESLVDRGFFVVRYDNRDTGLSTKFPDRSDDVMAELLRGLQGEPVDAPYRLSDMAADGIGLLDHLGIDSAHVVGVSMGGMLVQTMAIEHPTRVRTLTSIMSTTGEPEVGMPTAEAMTILLAPPPTGRDAVIEASVAGSRVIGSPDHFDEGVARERAAAAYDRAFHPDGVGRHLLAIMASGSRAEALADLRVPTLVAHGDVDPLITPSGGHRTAELIPGADLLVLEGMGHDLQPLFIGQLVEAITRLTARANA